MRRAVIFMLMASVLLSSVAYAHTTEFSGNKLPEEWILESTGESRINIMNGMMAVIAKSGHAKCLVEALSGDWTIETYVTSTAQNDESFHGLAIDNGVEMLCFGRDSNGLKAFISDNNNRVIINTHGIVGEYLQIRKITRGSSFSTYWLYSSSSERNTVVCVGKYEDTEHLFDANVKYGFYSEALKESNAVYDFFVDTVPENEYDWFSACEVNPMWAIDKKGIAVSQRGKLVANILSISDRTDPRIALRYPINQDWIIDTKVNAKRSFKGDIVGLLLYIDTENYLLFGIDNEEKLSSCICLDGNKNINSFYSEGTRIRIAKKGNIYSMYCSNDGLTWNMLSTWTDLEDKLNGAQLGFGYIGNANKNIEVEFQYYRENPYPNGAIREVTNLVEICREIGKNSDGACNASAEEYDFYGGDLGVLVDAGEKTFMMFGDSFSAPNQQGTWRSNVLAIIEDNDAADGLKFSNVITNKYGKAKQMIPSKHKDFDDMTSIPTSGIYIDGRLYIHYFNVYHWSANAHADFNYSGWAYSDDEGASFKTTGVFFEPDSHFLLASLVRVEDEIYIFGTKSIRFSGVYLAKVDADKLLDKSAYKYYVGNDERGNPCWSDSEENIKEIIKGFVGEFSVVYNEWLERYTITYLDESTLDLEIRDSETLWGEWSYPVTLVDRNVPGYTELIYAPFMLPKYFDNDGETIYFTTSKWSPYSVYWEKAKIARQ